MFYYNYVALCNHVGKSPSAVAEELGYQRSVVTRWRKGTMPRQATLQRIADYFKVSVADLTSEQDITERFLGPDNAGSGDTGDPFFHLRQGLAPYNITVEDADYIVKMFQLHAESNKRGQTGGHQ